MHPNTTKSRLIRSPNFHSDEVSTGKDLLLSELSRICQQKEVSVHARRQMYVLIWKCVLTNTVAEWNSFFPTSSLDS